MAFPVQCQDFSRIARAPQSFQTFCLVNGTLRSLLPAVPARRISHDRYWLSFAITSLNYSSTMPSRSRSPSRGRSRTRTPPPNEARPRSPTPSRSRTPRRSISPRSVSRSRSPSHASPDQNRRNGRRTRTRSRSPERARSRDSARYRERSYERDRSPAEDAPVAKSSKVCTAPIKLSFYPLTNQIVVEKLTKNVNEEHLKEIFGAYGPIQEIDLPMNRQC